MARDHYDYIVVGGGSSGCVIANRLSADPAVRVALVEAGPSDMKFPASLKTSLPPGYLLMLQDPRFNWQEQFEPHAGTLSREIGCPRGKVLGGCSSINGSVYSRGHRLDYDDWHAQGNPGWSWDEVLPMFKRHENHVSGGDTQWHGRGGELQVSVSTTNPLAHAFVEATVACGHAHNPDTNAAEQDGFGLTHVTLRRGVRSSASRAFIHPVVTRPNLHILTDTMVERVCLQKGRATGVMVVHRGVRRELHASAEVILAAGAVKSPQLLMLSGIGPAAHLESLGLRTSLGLDGVGGNLQDHPTVQVANLNPSAESYAVSLRSLPKMAAAPFAYMASGGGMLGSNAAEAGGYLRTQSGLDRPDIQVTFVVGMRMRVDSLPREHGVAIMVHLMRPRSRGRLLLRSADPQAAPLLRPDFLSDLHDVDTLARGVREARRFMAAEPLARYLGEEVRPDPAARTDEELRDAIRRTAGTAYHPVGTCRMGPDSDARAVVDAQLRVHGIDGLRVADASIMPDIVGGNTNAPCMMIGEQLSRFILEGAGAQRRKPGPAMASSMPMAAAST